MKITDIAAAVETIAPLSLAQAWDNVGLLVGESTRDVKSILLTIDITKAVLAEAKKAHTDLIISYHPVIWDGLKNVTSQAPGNIVYELIRADIAVFSMHTALDAAPGGVNDAMSEIVGIENGQPIGDYVSSPAGDNYKLVVFIPREAADKVADAIFAAGGGAIGNYSRCGFQIAGEGTFLPNHAARPAIGRKGKLQKVDEVRFETILPHDRIAKAVAAMRQAHPYEMPAFDVIKLYDFESKFGLGRFGDLPAPQRLSDIIARIKKHTGAKAVGIVGPGRRMVRSAAVCVGSCGKIINLVIAANCDLYVTGELKHHQALAAQEANLTCLCLSHSVSERFILKKFAKKLQKQLKDVTIRTSKADADPFIWKNL